MTVDITGRNPQRSPTAFLRGIEPRRPGRGGFAARGMEGVAPAVPFLREQFVGTDPVRVAVRDRRDQQLVGSRGLLELVQLVQLVRDPTP